MRRETSSRRCQRGKGTTFVFRNAAVLVSLLVACCLWVVYQMEQHPHGEKKAHEVRNSNASFEDEEWWFGRKYLSSATAQTVEQEEEGVETVASLKEAGEISLRGDDSSSELLVRVFQEIMDAEQASSLEARERSYTADDASSAVF